MARWGKTGISFFAHGGMWGDFFLLPVLFAFIITKYGKGWDTKQIAIMATIGIAVTLGNHLNLIFNQTVPDPLGWKDEKWSTLIAMHFVYMSTYVALAGLFYFSPNVSVKAAVAVSVVLGIHMAFGTHVLLGMLNRWFQWEWCPDFLSSPGLPWIQAVIWTALAGFSWVAAGWRAGLVVGSIGGGFAALVVVFAKFGPPPVNTYGS